MALQNDFLPFATAPGANVLSQSAYAGNSAVSLGVASGTASSSLNNKVTRQGSIAAYLIGNLINNEANLTALDNSDLVTLYNNFIVALGAVANSSGAATLPEGRLTLSSEAPTMGGSAVIGATEIIYTPYAGNRVPVWNGTSFTAQPFSEINQSLGDATRSPSAAVGGAIYDMFVWSIAGTIVLSRGPAWANPTTRLVNVARTQGILVNSTAITNGPAGGYGVYVGTIMTDPTGSTCSFNSNPAASSGGPSGGAWIGLWNYYNRVTISAVARDSNSWTYNSGAWRQADNSANNQVSFVLGMGEDSIACDYQVAGNGTSVAIVIGIGVDSVTVPSVANLSSLPGANISMCKTTYMGQPGRGQHYLSALEATALGTVTFYGTSQEYTNTSSINGQIMQLSALLRF